MTDLSPADELADCAFSPSALRAGDGRPLVTLAAALTVISKVEAQRDLLRGQAEELAHALDHVLGCPMGCAECRKVTKSAMDHENLGDFMDQQAWMAANDEGEGM